MLCVALTSYWYRTHPVLKERDASKLLAAVQAFSRDQVARRRPLPGSVTLRELTEGGYITASDIRAFEGMDVSISLTADDRKAQQILILFRSPDGSQTTLQADGSVQGSSK